MNKIRQTILIRKVRNNNSEAFGEIYDEYIKKIYQFIFFKVPTREIAQDLSQEVFTALLDYLRKTDQEIKELQALIYKIARHKIADYYQKLAVQDRKVELIENILPLIDQSLKDKDNSLEIKIDQRISVELAMKHIKKIKNKDYQEIIILRFLEDLSFKQISKIMNKKINTLQVMLHRAMKELKENISQSSKKNNKNES